MKDNRYIEPKNSIMSVVDYSKLPWEPIEYPSSDGKPMADNTKQARWIITLYNNLKGLFSSEEVFIAADLLWYPVEGRPDISSAPDVMMAFGRPDGDRSSYLQWKEEGLAPQVVFEVLSPSNTAMEMMRKQLYYEKYGVEEYIVIDPGKQEGDPESFLPYLRKGNHLSTADFEAVDWISERLGIRFRKEDNKVQVYDLQGNPFRTFEAVKEELDTVKQRAETEKKRADKAEKELEKLKAQLRDQKG